MNLERPVSGTYFVWRVVIAGLVVATAANIFSAQQTPTPAGDETASLLFQQALPNVEGRTFTSLMVELPPGGRTAPHRHGAASVYAYVPLRYRAPARRRADPHLPRRRELV